MKSYGLMRNRVLQIVTRKMVAYKVLLDEFKQIHFPAFNFITEETDLLEILQAQSMLKQRDVSKEKCCFKEIIDYKLDDVNFTLMWINATTTNCLLCFNSFDCACFNC